MNILDFGYILWRVNPGLDEPTVTAHVPGNQDCLKNCRPAWDVAAGSPASRLTLDPNNVIGITFGTLVGVFHFSSFLFIVWLSLELIDPALPAILVAIHRGALPHRLQRAWLAFFS
jgi:hypothetical protein